ncbi:hypothetical protein [Candidatus Nanohalovita haloferacivicina]|uniref:hypothetical protein n=1 Tax=Candidatus Nanohalovita haloferacivicina TaxID=2978046 RepID=UPI00325FD69A|nr:hypothetical protein HBNXNv_0426 [Candidatus Nanohalobia archaeon BNXNv]
MSQVREKSFRTEEADNLTFNDIFEALGGSSRTWHPGHTQLERENDVSDRMDFSPHTEAIGRMGEEYLQDTYNMEIVDDGEVDLVVTDGVFEGIPVQSKCAIRVASRGNYISDGGIYMKGPAMARLAGGSYNENTLDYEMNGNNLKEGLLHAIVHQPRESYPEQVKEAVDAPIRDIVKKKKGKIAETFIVGEAVIPADRALESVKFDTGDRRASYWNWSKAYQPAKDDRSEALKPSDWYSGSFIEDRIRENR